MQPGPYKNYYGGKNGEGVYQAIINNIRPHDVYMELFLGNGAVFRAKRRARQNIISDVDTDVYNAWLAAVTDKSIYADTLLMNRNAIHYLEIVKFNPKRQYCIYLDPPYPVSSRSEGRERYQCELTDHGHRELLRVIRQLPANVDVLISTYENLIYSELLADWHLITFQGVSRQGPKTEYLYMNYDPSPGILHDYSYLGSDYIDRQRIKRKITSQIDKLKSLPNAERNAILDALLELRTSGIDENVFAAAQINPSVKAHLGQHREMYLCDQEP